MLCWGGSPAVEESDRGGRGFHQAEAEILEAIARTHGSLSEPLGAVRNALLAADLRKEIQDEVPCRPTFCLR